MARALLITVKEIEKFSNKSHEEAKNLEKAIQEITDMLWNKSETRKEFLKEFFEAMEDGMTGEHYEKLYGLLGRIMDDGIKHDDEIIDILRKYDV